MIPAEINCQIKERFDEIQAARGAEIALFKGKRRTEVAEECKIVGYDPMNMYRVGDYVMCAHFVFLSKANPQSINKPVLLQMKHGSANEVVALFAD